MEITKEEIARMEAAFAKFTEERVSLQSTYALLAAVTAALQPDAHDATAKATAFVIHKVLLRGGR